MIEPRPVPPHNAGAVSEGGITLSDLRLKRGIFGYTSKSVGFMLADRNRMFLEVAEAARVAEARVAELQTAVEAAERELEGGTEELRTALEAAEGLRLELESTRAELEESRAVARQHTERLGELEAALGQRDEEATRARSAEAEADRLRSQLERATDDLTRRDERVSTLEALTEQLQTDLARTRDELGSAELEARAAERRTEAAEIRSRDVEVELGSMMSELEGSRGEVESLRSELEGSRSELESLREQLSDHPAQRDQRLAGAPATAEEVSLLLRSTEEVMARIIEDARGRSDEELREAERARIEIQDETQRLLAWRDRIAPLVGEFRLSVEEARTRATDLRDRVHEVVGPMTETITALGLQLEELARIAATSPEPDRAEEITGAVHQVIELREPEVAAEGWATTSDRGSAGDHGAHRPW